MLKNESNEKQTVIKEKKAKVGGMSSDTKIILGIIGGMILICASLIFYYFYGVNNQVVATYKNGKVTRGEYEMYYKLYQPMLTYYGYDKNSINEEVLNKIVIDKLVLKEAKKEELKLTKDEKKTVNDEFKDKENVEYFTGLGITEEKAKQLYLDDALINKYIEAKKTAGTPETIREFILSAEGEKANLNTFSTSYILYSTADAKDKDAKAKVKESAQATLDRIKNGEDFATIGEELNNAGTAQYSGSYTLSLNGTSVKDFEDAVSTLGAGQLYQELVDNKEYGYFIIKVNSITENGRLEDQDAYVNQLLAKMQKDADVKAKDKRITKIVKKLSAANSSDSSESSEK